MLHKLGFKAISRQRLLEVILVSIALSISIGTVFWQIYPLGYLIIPLLLWISLSLRRFETGAAILLVSSITLFSTAHGVAGWSLHKSVIFLQAYIGFTATTALFLLVNIHSETTMRTMQRRLNDIIEFLPDATFAINKDGMVISWNRAIEILTGIGKADMIGKGDYAYSVPIFGEPRPILIVWCRCPTIRHSGPPTMLSTGRALYFWQSGIIPCFTATFRVLLQSSSMRMAIAPGPLNPFVTFRPDDLPRRSCSVLQGTSRGLG